MSWGSSLWEELYQDRNPIRVTRLDPWETEVNRLEQQIRQSQNVPNYILNIWLENIDQVKRRSRLNDRPLPRVVLRQVISQNVSRDPVERMLLFNWFNSEIVWNWGGVEPIPQPYLPDLPMPM
jgi:hypothetical protein